MLWTWYGPWARTMRLWEQTLTGYWQVMLPARGKDQAPPADARADGLVLYGWRVGDRLTLEQTVSEEDLGYFAAISGDCNPIHLDDSYAARTRFGERIAHGMLSAAFISAALAKMGGSEATTIYLSQSLRFLRPVMVGAVITTEVEVLSIDAAQRRMTVATSCRNQQGQLVVTGEAGILLDRFPYAG